MAAKTIEVTVISAENLQSNNRPYRKSSYVTVRTDAAAKFNRTAETDCDGGVPRWNEKLVLELPAGARSLVVNVLSHGGGRTIGAATIPVTDFSGDMVPEGYLHFLSYRLRDERGVRNGIVNISVRTKVPEGHVAAYARKAACCAGCATTTSSQQTNVGYPAAVGTSFGGGSSGGVATGVPVNWGHGRPQAYY